jgi:hypothetical protein
MGERKNNYSNFIYILIIGLSIAGCKISNQHISKKGVVAFITKFYNKDSGRYIRSEEYGPTVKLWYKDSIVIIQNMAISFATDTNNIETQKAYILNYIYINLPQKKFYRYTTFTDTAQIIDSYTQDKEDSILWGVSWKFYKWNEMPHTEPFAKLKDTIIDNREYKRMKIVDYTHSDSINKRISIAYFDCNRSGTIFQINKQLSEIVGCPMVKLYVQPSEKYQRTIGGELDFISDKLTTEELKIFDAWERNVKKYPVKE